MIKVIKNGLVITMDDKRKNKYEYVDIVISDNIISEITKDYRGKYDMLIDANGMIVMPGLINSHTHLGMSIFRSSNDNLTLNDWLNKKIWPIEDNLNNDDLYYSTKASCIEMIKTGTVMANDMYFNSEGILRAVKETKVRCLYGRCLMNHDNNADYRLDEFWKFYKNNDNPLVRFSVAPHAFYTCSKDYLKKASDIALEEDLPIHIHLCENDNEYNEIVTKYGSIVNAFMESGLYRNKLILAHTTCIDDEFLDFVKGKNVSFVHNPVSNLCLGCGIADISKYSKYVNISLGTDGAGSAYNMNLFYHMSIVDLLQKGLYKDPTMLDSYEVLKMATINGAKALFVDDIIGSIEVGKCADLIMLPNKYMKNDLINDIVHNTNYGDVDTTIINGEILLRNHELVDKNLDKNLDLELERIIKEKMTD